LRARPAPGLALQCGLFQLDGPVAQLVPDELIDSVGRVAEAEFFQRRAGLVGAALEAREDPAVVNAGGLGLRVVALRVHQDEARGVPDLAGEGAIALD